MSALKCRGDSGIEKAGGVCPGTNYLKVFWFNEDLRLVLRSNAMDHEQPLKLCCMKRF